MKIIKNKGILIVAVLIVLVVYNVIAFLLPFSKGATFWTGYGFTMLAIVLTACVSFYSLGRENLRSKVYGWPLISLAWSYMVLQLVLGMLEILLTFIPFQFGIILNVVLLGACLIGLVAVNLSKEEVERIDEKIEQKVFFIKSLQAETEGMVDRATDEEIKRSLKDLVNALKYSDPMSSFQLASIENDIEIKVAELVEFVEQADHVKAKSMCDEIQKLIADRNRKCKLLK